MWLIQNITKSLKVRSFDSVFASSGYMLSNNEVIREIIDTYKETIQVMMNRI